MKYAILGLMAATLLANPAFATSWRTELFARLDANTNGELTVSELEQTGCTVNKKFFAFADSDKNSALSKFEFFDNRELFSRCK